MSCDGEERARHLQQLLSEDIELHTRVMRLLVAAELAGNSRALMQPLADSFYATRACETRLVGHSIGPYTITERIGGGGMAEVYKAFHAELSVYRALKVIRPELSLTPDFRTRFQKEARLVASLRHPNIVQVHDFGTHDNSCYMVMEFIEGEDLRRWLRTRGQIRPIQEAVDIVVQVANALEYAHARGLIHRDIKPENIMITPNGQPILMDFGIAKILTGATQLTQTGAAVGTPAYMAPEQALAPQDIGPPVDVYALTIVLFELLTGRTPYEANAPVAAILKSINIGEALQSAIIKGAAKDVAGRFQSVASLRDALIEAAQSDARSAAGETTDAAPMYIATVPRKGYRLIASVRSLRDDAASEAPAAPANQTPAISAPTSSRRPASRILHGAALGLAVLAAAASILLWRNFGQEPRAASLVVLPFVDLSEGGSDSAFCDGLTEELSTTLSHLPSLRVVARTSAYAFRDKPMDVREIGRRLAASHVLEGSVRRSGDAVRVTARLVDAQRGSGTWSESYDLPVKDVLSLQTDIARSVAAALQIGLPAATSTRIGARGSHNAAAYELYLLGRHYYRQRTPEGNATAADLNSRAIALDGDFALAYVGLAQARLSEYALTQKPIHELSGEVERLVAVALRLDPELSDAYATRGALRREQNRLQDAETDLRRAIDLNPNNVTAAIQLGRVFEHRGLLRPAVEQFTKARLLDPMDFMRHVERCIGLQDLGEYTEAARDCAEGRRLQPASEWGFMATSWLARAQGQLADALHWNDDALRVAPRNLELYMQRAELLLDMHALDEVQSTLDRARAVAGDDPRLRYRYADLLLLKQGRDALRKFVAQLPPDKAANATDLMVAAQISLTAGDDATARALAARAVAAPDFESLQTAQHSAASWGMSFQLPFALLELRSGDRDAGVQRVSQLLLLLDEMERNGYASWGVYSLRADAYGLLGEADKAMESLQRAVEAGWRSDWAALRDPYLAALFDRDDFKALMRSVEELNAMEWGRYVAAQTATG